MHETILAHAVNPRRAVILRRQMTAYSLANELLLFGEENPFVTGSMEEFKALPIEEQIHAVIRAVDICAVAPEKRKWWQRKSKETPIHHSEYGPAIEAFWNHLHAGRLQFNADLPKDDDVPVKYVGSPEILRLYQFVCATVPREEILLWGTSAWDFPYSFAKMLWQSHAESLGNLEIYNFKHKSHDDFVQTCEVAREAWMALPKDATVEQKLAVLKEHPPVRELPDFAEEIAKLEETVKGGASWPA